MTRRFGSGTRRNVALVALVLLGMVAPLAVHTAGRARSSETLAAPAHRPDVTRAATVAEQSVAMQPAKPRPTGIGLAVAVALIALTTGLLAARRRSCSPPRDDVCLAPRRGPPILSTV